MTYDYLKLTIIIVGTLLFSMCVLVFVRGTQRRFLLLGFLSGLFFYNGIGAASTEVAPLFILFYFILFISVIIGFYISCLIFLPAGHAFGDNAKLALKSIDNNIRWSVLIYIYLFLSAVPLFYPEFCIDRLFMPPAPDLNSYFFEFRMVVREVDIINRLAGYGLLLVTPFFYIAIYRFRYRLWLIIFLLSLPLYFKYVNYAYISRNEVLENLLPVLLAVWFLRPNYRRSIILCCATMAPIFFYGLYYYQIIREGATVHVGFTEAISRLFSLELNFVKNVGMPLIKSGERINLGAYFTWIMTIPIPKILTGPFEVPLINDEISQIVLGIPRGLPGFNIVLPGLVAESIYIYGLKFFWLHGLFCGFIFGIFARLLERVPQFIFLYCYVVFIASFTLNRAGIGAFLPLIINQFIFFYFILILVFTFCWRPKQHKFCDLSVSCK